MKKTIIKFVYSIIAFLMIVPNGVVAFATTPWTVNSSDYQYDMSLYIDLFSAVGKLDYSQYEVGIFCEDECRGIAMILSLGNGEECLYLRARSNQEANETMTFKYYDVETGEIKSIEDTSIQFESNGRLGYPSAPFIIEVGPFYNVKLTANEGGSIDQEGGRMQEGTELIVTASPEEGYHFDHWSDGVTDNPRTLVVDADLTLIAEFSANTYKLIYMLDDGEVFKEHSVEFGAEIVSEAFPEKEGYTFSGWVDVPETMPPHDVTILGSFSVNSYKATFEVDGEVIATGTFEFGQSIDIPVFPEREGYTFSGWESVPETMPAYDLTIQGRYTINSYCVSFYIDDELYSSEMLEYGSPIVVTEPEEPEGMKFQGWIEEIPEFMPAHDLEIHGNYAELSAIESILTNESSKVTILNLKGQVLFKDRSWDEVKMRLGEGVYIVNGRKYMINKP